MTIYYIDPDGDNAFSGKTAQEALRSPSGLPALARSDTVLFRRGGYWTLTDPLLWGLTGIGTTSFGAYGIGPRPTLAVDGRGDGTGLDISGHYLTISGLRLTLINPLRNPSYPDRVGRPNKQGFYVGITVSGQNIRIRDCEFDNLALGVNFTDSSADCSVEDCVFHNLNAMWLIGGAPGIMGGMGVMLHGTRNRVQHNHFWENGVEVVLGGVTVNYSAPVEFYNANECSFDHNLAFDHRKNGEMGKATDKVSRNNRYTHNLIVSGVPAARGPNIHGTGTVTNPDRFGPVENTLVEFNTILLPDPTSEAIICSQPGQTVRNNILSAGGKSGFFKLPQAVSYNVFWGSRPQFVGTAPAYTYSDPKLDGNYQPLVGSPCMGQASDGTNIGAPSEDEMAIKISDVQALAQHQRDLASNLNTLSETSLTLAAQAKALAQAALNEADLIDRFAVDLTALDAAVTP